MSSPAESNAPPPQKEKGAAPPKSAGSKPPPPKPAAPPLSPPKRGCLPLIFWLAVLLGGLAAAVHFYPQQIKQWTGWELRLPALGASEEEAAPSTPSVPTVAAEDLQAAITRLEGEVRTLKNQAAANAADGASAFGNRLNAVEEQLAAVNRQLAVLSNQRHQLNATQLQLQLIDMRLRLDGDTAQAAAALRRLADAPEAGDDTDFLLGEAARLERIPSRQTLLQLLDAVAETAAPESAPAAESADGAGWVDTFLTDIMKVQREEEETLPSVFADDILYLKWLLLSGQSAAYHEALQGLASSFAADGDYQKLAQYGAPDYRLRLP